MSVKAGIKLYLRRNDYHCNYVFGLMNYNNLDFDLFVETKLSSLRIAKGELATVKTLPLLVVDKDKIVRHYEGIEAVLGALKDLKLTNRGVTHSAWEDQSCTFITDTVIPAFEIMKSRFSWHLQESYFNSGILNAKTGDYFAGLLHALSDALALQVAHRKFWFHNKSKATAQFLEALRNWEERLGTRNYHGDTSPDRADLLMFSVLACYQSKTREMIAGCNRVQLWKDRLAKVVDPIQW